jgi:glucose/mannose-6-phosphate isomerase
LNENSKSAALSATLPELCHNFIVGLDFPSPEKLFVIFLESSYGFSRNVARRQIIEKIFAQKDIPFLSLSVKAGSALSEQWHLIYFGDLLSYYLAGVNGVDPSPIEAIGFLKTELKKV